MQHAVIWDLNGVIIDDMPFHLRAYQQYLSGFGYTMTEAYFHERCTGTAPTEVFAQILPAIGSPVTVAKATEDKRDIYFDLIRGRMQMLPGVRELVESLGRSGWPQAIASGATRLEVDTILDEFNLRAYFEAIVTCEDVNCGKPDPEPFLTAALRLGVDPSSCTVIEDGEYGVRAAHACGMRAIAVTNTQTAAQLAAADMVVNSLADIEIADIERLIAARQ